MCEHCSCSKHGAEGEPFNLAAKVDYAPDSVVSSTLADNDAGTLTLFAFDAGQRLSTHSAPYAAIVQVIDGEAKITVDGEEHCVEAGEMLIMPADVPHAVEAEKRFKMVLTMFRA